MDEVTRDAVWGGRQASGVAVASGATGMPGSARLAAQVLTGIQLGFGGRGPRTRARALGLYSLVLSAGAVAGQSLGGLLISADVAGTTWRPAFGINVPAGLVLLWLAWRYLPADGRRGTGAAAGTGAGLPGGKHSRLRAALVRGAQA